MKLNSIYDQGAMRVHIAGGVVCAVLLGFGWFFGLGPLVSESEQYSAVVEQADEAEQRARASMAELNRVSKELDAVMAELEKQPVQLSSAGQINALLNELSGWAKAQRLSLTRMNAGSAIELAYYDYVPVVLWGEGAYGDLLGLFEKLHRDRRDLGVVSFEVRRMNHDATLVFELNLAWYVERADIQLPGTEATAGVQAE